MNALTVGVPASLDGVRVDRAVALLADLSRSAVNALVEGGGIEIDGTVVRSRSTVLRVGQELRVDRSGQDVHHPVVGDASVAVEVVHADADLIVVDKPAGVVVHPGAGHRNGTLVHGLLAVYPELGAIPGAVGGDPERPGIVHRLDRGTSGLMVVARRPDAYRSLVAQLGERRVSRTYQVLVLGSVEGPTGIVDAPIGRSATTPTRMAVSRRGKEARTRYQVDHRFGSPQPTTLMTVSLETGRTHQIRVHLAAIGHPVVGDAVYGGGRKLPGATLERPFLHACRLSFEHPRSKEHVWWSSELPDDLRHQLAGLSA